MAMKAGKLAVLMPVFNGGEKLRTSLLSCAQAGLDPAQYEIIVVDNQSTDGAAGHLPLRDANGAAVQVHRNAANLGRVGNWNRAVEIALAQGFGYATFLFVGDGWLPGGSLAALFQAVRESDCALGLSPFVIGDENGNAKRSSRRFYVAGHRPAVVDARTFLSTLLESGLFPLGPVQANIYRLSAERALRFDDSLPTRTDVNATLEFIIGCGRPVALGAEPFLLWREYKGRFHASMGAAQTVRDYMDTFHAACEQTGIPVNYGRAKARAMLNSARLIVHDAPCSQWPALLKELSAHSRKSPYRTSWFDLCETLWLRFALGRRLLEFS